MVRKISEWDRHIRRFWALNRAHSAVMRQVVVMYGKEPEIEAFLRGIADKIEAAIKAEVEIGWSDKCREALKTDCEAMR